MFQPSSDNFRAAHLTEFHPFPADGFLAIKTRKEVTIQLFDV